MAKKVWKYFRKYKYLRMYFWKYNTGSPTYLATFEGTKVRRYFRRYLRRYTYCTSGSNLVRG
ncbi:uncharacterized protein MICPUCDRAFT_55420 [Micromonas pusilla CCMP1545]|uniref:Predicted protein n=1 Tax=Micromonas pusilla (strain CCMP1545) TaxID=564608 RepID=C1MKQ5_MICPC|nr:uncharacterized protein MICPUCDRAFT_55420 [Micromonas pusilla CCMP1545]EEH59803.1 predicted protein [Micromonas pusilla CCMP1545]|eukprot:XP_003056427.1 predicted protein [Micromonas pusilla CCMP1545]